MGGRACLKKVKDLPAAATIMETDREEGETAPAHITIPQPDGPPVPIPTLEVSTSSEMLGVFFRPDSDGSSHMQQMKAKGAVRLERLEAKPLPPIDAWLSFHLQLHLGITWGLPTVILPPLT